MCFLEEKIIRELHQELLIWYEKNKRPLPWRQNNNPYHIWLSEIMLQQTRVETVIPYFYKFLKFYPTVQHLARAKIDDIRAHWAGLGYYSRAINLHKAAQILSKMKAFPSELSELQKLPGIGPYTSAAIASIAFDKRHAAIDGNLERVLSRIIALKKIAKNSAEVRSLANDLVQLGKAGDLNQSLMDISATICLIKKPRCGICPIQRFCITSKENLSDSIPVKASKRSKDEIESQGVLLIYNNKKKNSDLNSAEILVSRRPKGSWLSEMWDIPWWIADSQMPDSSLSSIRFHGKKKITRTITHHKINFNINYIFLKKKFSYPEIRKKFRAAGTEFRWQTIDRPLPKPSQKIIQLVLKSHVE